VSMRSPEKMIPATKPSTPKTSGNGTSVLKPNNQRGTRPATPHAAAQVKPIPIAPRMRRSHFPMIASDPGPAHELSPLHSVETPTTLCCKVSGIRTGFKSAHRRSDEAQDDAKFFEPESLRLS